MRSRKWGCDVPRDLMIDVGAWATREFQSCADTWTDSQLGRMRAKLPSEYHGIPLDHLRRYWINLRKNGTEGFRLNGKGPSKGSRKKIKRKTPSWYQDYLNSDDWNRRRIMWLEFWGHRCAVCNGPKEEVQLDVHHRDYSNRGQENLTDCIVLCRRCHELYEANIEEDPRTLF